MTFIASEISCRSIQANVASLMKENSVECIYLVRVKCQLLPRLIVIFNISTVRRVSTMGKNCEI